MIKYPIHLAAFMGDVKLYHFLLELKEKNRTNKIIKKKKDIWYSRSISFYYYTSMINEYTFEELYDILIRKININKLDRKIIKNNYF